MGLTPAEILSSADGLEDFRNSIISLRGDFPFEAEDMLQLGRVYLLRFPDTDKDRNMDNIRMGYRIVRICILEKILDGIEERYCAVLRGMFDDIGIIDTMLEKLVKKAGIEEVESFMYIVERNLDRIRGVIDGLPRGMTMERFISGISKFYNEIYLMNEAMKKLRRGL